MLLEDNASLLPLGVFREMQTGFVAAVRLHFYSRTPPFDRCYIWRMRSVCLFRQATGRDRGRSSQKNPTPIKPFLPALDGTGRNKRMLR